MEIGENTVMLEEHFDYAFPSFAVVGNRAYFENYRDALIDAIKNKGFEAVAAETIEEACNYDVNCVIVINPLIYPSPNDAQKIWVAIQSEQLCNLFDKIEKGGNWVKDHLAEIEDAVERYDIILDFTRYNIEIIKKFAKDKVVRLFQGSHYDSRKAPTNIIAEKKYDIFFVGTLPGEDNRRQILLDELKKHFILYPSFNVWGEDKFEAMLSSKICLNLHYQESNNVERGRILDFFANECFVMTERIFELDPFVDGEDYVSFYLPEMIDKIKYYLAHDELREQIAQSAFNKTQKHNLNDKICILIDEVIAESYSRKKYGNNSNRQSLKKRMYRIMRRLRRKLFKNK